MKTEVQIWIFALLMSILAVCVLTEPLTDTSDLSEDDLNILRALMMRRAGLLEFVKPDLTDLDKRGAGNGYHIKCMFNAVACYRKKRDIEAALQNTFH